METVQVKLTEIDWDTDGEDVELPSEMTVEVERQDGDDDNAVMDAAIDVASDQTGWCINGALTEIV